LRKTQQKNCNYSAAGLSLSLSLSLCVCVCANRDMPWTYGSRPPLHVAVGKNPDGSYGIGIANPTGIPVKRNLNGKETQIFPNASTVVLELVLGELQAGGGGAHEGAAELRFVARRSTGDESFSVPEADVVLAGGVLRVRIGPNQVLTLRSTAEPAGSNLPSAS
jgi:hypothetical protein